MTGFLASLPTYDLGPGRSGDELAVNVIIYAVALIALGALGWIAALVWRAVGEERRRARVDAAE